VVTHSRRSALALTVLGLFLLCALVFDPTAGAKLPPTHAVGPLPEAGLAALVPTQPVPTQILTVRAGDTLMYLLQRAGLAATSAQAAIDALKRDWDPRALKIGQEITLGLDQGDLKQLRLSPDLQHDLVLTARADGHYDVAAQPRDLVRVPTHVAGSISSSLFEAARNAGMPQAVLSDVIHAFSFDVDFQREIQPGDSFEVMYEQPIENASGKLVGTGDPVYAALILSGHAMQLYRYAHAGASPEFYNASGAGVKKALLRTPVDGARISSPFGVRMHPILGYSAMHQGVDFAVPAGTPIMASGDGVVATAGWDGGYGNLVVLRHESSYSTAYAHMSRIAKGIKPGLRIHQGDVIGYVGATGLATGPHLHYEVRINDRPVNPMGVRMPAAQKLQGRDLAAFQQQAAAIDQRLAALRTRTVAAK
jgi:murein DD-endopeptidase MepM/ murein hydrolase activator NlpD